MFWEDTPFEDRAAFMKDNVMEPSPDFVDAFEPAAHPGFEGFRQLLLGIYSTPAAFQAENSLERFHLLSYVTQLFFSAIAQVGSLVEGDDALRATKTDFKKAYKKPGDAPFALLPCFGVVFEYTKKEKQAPSYATCDAFCTHFPGKAGIPAALKQMARHFDEVDHKREYAEALAMLGKADYDRLVLGHPALREEIDPLRPDIVRSTGEKAGLYRKIIEQGRALGFSTQVYLQRYANPSWNVNLYQGKKLRLKSIWGETRNFIQVPVPFEKAEPVIKNRQAYAPRVTEAIGHFGCVNCGRCKAGKPVKFKKIDGLTICTGHGESSTIVMELESAEELASLYEVIGQVS